MSPSQFHLRMLNEEYVDGYVDFSMSQNVLRIQRYSYQ